eukprot:scaffold140055_cov20-Prasinocladus_malaysianus.AAC.1
MTIKQMIPLLAHVLTTSLVLLLSKAYHHDLTATQVEHTSISNKDFIDNLPLLCVLSDPKAYEYSLNRNDGH